MKLIKNTIYFLLAISITCCKSTKELSDSSESNKNETFEGQIIYDAKLVFIEEDNISNLSGVALASIKNNKYIFNVDLDKMFQKQIYLGGDTTFLHTKFLGKETLMYFNNNEDYDKILSWEIIKNHSTINGVLCNLLKYSTEEGEETEYYYHEKTAPINPDNFTKAKYGFFNFTSLHTHSLPLKLETINESDGSKFTIIFKEIIPNKVNEKDFKLPNLKREVLQE